jgi:integrase/recombinase XerD
MSATPRYGWVAFCERVFDDIPAQIVFEWNSPRHSTDDDVPTGRRSLTRPEVQSLFDAVDDFVDAEYAKGTKRWLSALRDSTP